MAMDGHRRRRERPRDALRRRARADCARAAYFFLDALREGVVRFGDAAARFGGLFFGVAAFFGVAFFAAGAGAAAGAFFFLYK